MSTPAYQSNPFVSYFSHIGLVFKKNTTAVVISIAVNAATAIGFFSLLLFLLIPLIILAAGVSSLGVGGIIAVTVAGIAFFFIIFTALLVYASVMSATSVLIDSSGAAGKQVTFSDSLRLAWPFVLRIIGLNIVVGFLTFFATLLFIIPGIVVGTRLSLASYILVAENTSISEGIRRSWNLTRGHFFEVCAVSLIAAILSSNGLVTFPLFAASQGARYHGLKAFDQAQKIPTHALNYVVVIVGVFLYISYIALQFALGYYEDKSKPQANYKAHYEQSTEVINRG